MKLPRLVLVTAAILGVLCPMVTKAAEMKRRPPKAEPVKIVRSWAGKLVDSAPRKLSPVDGFVLDRKSWARLWKAWRGQEDVPEVDFQKQMLLVFTAEGPNSVGCTPTHDGRGNVQANASCTLIGGPGFGYLILCIPREGIRTVNGKPLAKGVITFIPDIAKGTKGRAAFGRINNGKVRMLNSYGQGDGAAVGWHRVRISSKVGVKDTIPPQYNTRTTLRFQAKAGKVNAFMFDLRIPGFKP